MVRVLELVNVLDRMHFSHRVKVEDHAMVALSYLEEVVVECELESCATAKCRIVSLWDLSHLNVLDVTLEYHRVDAKATTFIHLHVSVGLHLGVKVRYI